MNHRKNYQKWIFNANSQAIHHLHHNHIIIWNKGVCVAGYDQNDALIIAQSYIYDELLTAKDINNIILDDHLLGGTEPVTNIWYTSSRQSIFPKQLYKPNQAEAAIRAIYYIDPNENIQASSMATPNGHILYVVPKALKEQLEELFPNAISDNIINANPNRNLKAEVLVTVLPNFATISAYQDGKMLQYSTFECANIDDIMHYIGLFKAQFFEHSEKFTVDITGYGKLHDEIIVFAKDYFEIIEHGTHSFFKYLPTCE